MKIEKDAENILNKFSKTLEDIPDLEETWYITDNLNLTREDKSHEKHPEKILRNAHIDKEGKLVVKEQIGLIRGIFYENGFGFRTYGCSGTASFCFGSD